jgi:translation initiation factor 2 alpha subunit (eIF-2alpha)
MKVTTDDILDAILEAMNTHVTEEGSTITELCSQTGYGVDKVRKAVKDLLVQGKWEATRVRRTDMSGRMVVVPGYRVKR